jgi:hypothetical protein
MAARKEPLAMEIARNSGTNLGQVKFSETSGDDRRTEPHGTGHMK